MSIALGQWLEELSLTPRFDERSALALAEVHGFGNGREAWLSLTSPSSHPDYIENLSGGFFCIESAARMAMRMRVGPERARELHQWFHSYWKTRQDNTLIFYHQWNLDPLSCLFSWKKYHEESLQAGQVQAARHWLESWREIDLDGVDRATLQDELWADTHIVLGNALMATPTMNHDTKLRSVIAHYRAALYFYDKVAHSEEWADLQNNLGQALRALESGDKITNLQEAALRHESALQIYLQKRSPPDVAMLRLNLATIYLDLAEAKSPLESEEAGLHIQSDDSVGDEIEKGIVLCNKALEFYTELEYPDEWARAHNTLGSAFLKRRTGGWEENDLVAQEHFEAALRIRTKEKTPQEWAGTHNNLALTFYRRTSGDPEDNTRQAVHHFQEALSVRNEHDFPLQWARIQVNLGNALAHAGKRKRDSGDYEDFWQAIVHFQNALRVFTETEFPQLWAMTHFNLATTFAALYDQIGEKSTLEKVREHLQSAVAGFDRVGLGNQPSALTVKRMLANINFYLQG